MRAARWLLLLVLAGCVPSLKVGITPEQRDAWGLQKVISGFAPDRGEGSKYKVGEVVFFKFTLSQPGYVTLITIDPDTTTAVLERNVRVLAGPQTFPRKTDVTDAGQGTYKVFPPTGVSRFRLIFSDTPTTRNLVSSSDGEKIDPEELNNRTEALIASAKVRDVVETTMETVK